MKSVLKFNGPAEEWIEGFPLGNGTSAAMAWGPPSRLTLCLNHIDFWRDHAGKELPDCTEYVARVRALLLEDKLEDVHHLDRETDEDPLKHATPPILPRNQRDGHTRHTGYTNSFQPIGNLVVQLHDQDAITEYRRALDLNHGLASITYKSGASSVSQEFFVPARADVLVVSMRSDQPLSGCLVFEREQQQAYSVTTEVHQNTMLVKGVFREGVESVALAAVNVSDSEAGLRADGASLAFDGVTGMQILVAVDSGRDQGASETRCRSKISRASESGVDALRNEHCAEHSEMFDRVSIRLGSNGASSEDDTDVLVKRALTGDYDHRLAELVFQMGRYLLMSSG